MKVLHIITDTTIGGAGIWVCNSVSAMSEDFDVYVALPRGSQLIGRLSKILEYNHIIEVDYIGDASFSFRGVLGLRRVIKELKPDIVHTHASLAGRIAGKISRGLAIVNSRHCIEPLPRGMSAIVKKIINNNLSHRIIAVSEAIYENLLASGVHQDKLVLLNNGVVPIVKLSEEEKNAVRDGYGINQETLVVGYIGRLEEVKGPLFLPEVVSHLQEKLHRPFLVLMAGEGSQKDALIQSIEKHHLTEVINYIGQIEDITSFYNSIDVLVNVSRSEGVPMSLIEGMSVGLPIISFDVGSLNQLIEEGQNGYRIEAFNTEAFAEKIALVLLDDGLRQKLATYSEKIMTERFHVNQMDRRLESIYREVKR